ncbi:MAG TPA: phosphoglycerate dehydrogenase [Acidimicrobiales bacterium]|nr:phosphoglycerate dehydrogenase [Acidimicrobiales bacterium]
MARILVTEKLAQAGLEAMAEAGFEVDEQLDWTKESLIELVKGANALVVRSATKVTRELLEAGTALIVVGRAGVGLDNVDIEAATELGIMVVNAPESNILSAAEHAFALLLAQARNIPQAHSALVAGRWERSKWEGVELHGKTLGVVGLGRIGALVAQRAMAFGMHVVAYDPYITEDRARRMGVELLSLDGLVARADFITIHLPKTKETAGLFNQDLLAKTKRGVRIINAARGGLIVEQDLADAINSGHVAGAALDVFDSEPATISPLFGLSSVVVTPHLGASTEEAQDKAGEQIAEQIVLALRGDFVPFAVNVSAGAASEAVRPYLGVAERLGRFLAELCEGMPDVLDVEFQGALAGENTSILTLSVLKGLLGVVTEEPVSYVNAPRIAEVRGLKVRESQSATSKDRHNVITVSSTNHRVSGTLRGGDANQPSFVDIDGHTLDLSPAACLLIVHNDDRPGMIGIVGTRLGEAGVSIVNMAVARNDDSDGTALMAIATDRATGEATIETLRAQAGILEVHQVQGV